MAIDANVFIDCESGSDGNQLTTTILNNATHGGSGTWSISPDPLTAFSVEDTQDMGALGQSVVVASTTYDGSGGTRGWDRDFNTVSQTVTYTVTTNSQVVSLGCYIKFFEADSFNSIDIIEIIGSSVDAVLQLKDWPSPDYGVLAHGSSPVAGSTGGHTIRVSPNTKYWMTLQYNGSTGLVRVAIHDPGANWRQVGTTSQAAIDTGSNVTSFRIGGGSIGAAGHVYMDNIVLDWTNGAFPLANGSENLSAFASLKRAIRQGTWGMTDSGLWIPSKKIFIPPSPAWAF